jgi:hypothetical protein
MLATAFGLAALTPVVSAAQSPSSIITFDAPGAGTGYGQGTTPYSINSKGVIVGYVTDDNNQSYGFLRHPDGTMSFVRAPGIKYTYVDSVNDSGTIAGTIGGTSPYAFLRTSDGTFTFFRPVGTQFLYGNTIDNLGNVAGTFLTIYDFFECYIRTSDGTITTFTPPGGFDCQTNDIVEGTVSGTYGGRSGWQTSFLRHPDGTFTTFRVGEQVAGAVINSDDTTAGSFYLSDSSSHGYVHAANGAVTYFDLTGAATIGVADINSAGALTGIYANTLESASHGFQRSPDGSIETFDAPGAGTGQFQGTLPLKINDAGTITGVIIDSNNVAHGFLGTP